MPDECAVLVAQQFLPLNVISAQRALRIARALLARYSRVIVVSADYRGLPPHLLDFDFGKDVLQNVRLQRIQVNPLLTGYGFSARPSRGQRLIGGIATRLLCSPGIDWIPGLKRSLRGIPLEPRVSLAIATGPPFIMFPAVTSWARQRGIPVILDYRDLWTENPQVRYPALAKTIVARLIERPVNRKATLLTTVSEGCKAGLERNATTAQIRLLFNSPDRAYLDEYRSLAGKHRSAGHLEGRPPGSLKIVFTGHVYLGSSFAPVLGAIASLPPDEARTIEMHYYGLGSQAVAAEVRRFGLEDRLVDHGHVSKADSIHAMLDADLLLSLIHGAGVADTPAVAGLMTTKVFDYMLSGAPILNIGPANAEIVGFAERIGCRTFHNFVADDRLGIATFLQRARSGGLHRAAPLAVSLPSFEDGFNAIIDEALAR